MKQIVFLCLFLLTTVFAFAGDYDFSALQGLRDKKGDIYFEISGYDIYVTTVKGKLQNKKTIDNIKKKQYIKNIQAEYSEPLLKIPNKIIEANPPLEMNPDMKFNEINYLLQESADLIKFISLKTLNQRDILLEKTFVEAFLAGSLDTFILDDDKAQTISFAGKTIELGTACEWRSPHNLYCKGGQISWSEFSSFDSADLDLEAHIIANQIADYTILSEEDIEVLFEDIPTVAYRVAYKPKYTYYPLIVYYLALEIRGRYVSCVLSHYGYNRDDYELALLLKQFMAIPELPDWAYNPLDVPKSETLSEKEKEDIFGYGMYIDVSASALIPLGNLGKRYSFAPALNVFMGHRFGRKSAVELGILVAVPVHPKQFDFYYGGENFETKTSAIPLGSLRYRYTDKIKEYWKYSLYGGVGFTSMTTNLEKGVNNEGDKTYHEVNSLDLHGGGKLKYKHIGCFLEYHYAPYTFSNKVTNTFGNSFLNIGFSYYFE
jgi:hypothetical protein